MYTSYHFTSAQELTPDIIRSIQDAFKDKPITIMVEEDETVPEGMTSEMVEVLEERLKSDEATHIDSATSITHLKTRYDLSNQNFTKGTGRN